MAKLTKAIASFLALASFTAAAPVAETTPSDVYPDGFPNPNADQLKQISIQADGLLSNAPPPPKLNASTLQSFQAIAFNEEFEVAFFTSLLYNVTNKYAGYESWHGHSQSSREKILKVVIAQEELHAINAKNVLTHFNQLAPEPCKYHFPTTNIKDAFALAQTFTALVLGTLQDVSQAAAASGDAGVVRAVASVIGQEGEQDGFYRIMLGRVPSQKPFLTTSVGPFLFSWLNNNFIVPNSCPFDVNALKIPIFSQLSVGGVSTGLNVDAKDQTLKFSTDLSKTEAAEKYYGGDGKGLFITYFSGQLVPFSVPISSVSWTKDHQISFEANFPYTENVMDGLSIAALTIGNGFTNPDAVPAATLAAPALIQVNDSL
ncbi:hypothetical protein PT974_11070 [Cladobotryum mycophilum]|uniref:Late sexual development protein n=1 Tax=Cladobotryum mycophilum TaxID=491253 RepID=A0ABR0SBJ0_9HYPO